MKTLLKKPAVNAVCLCLLTAFYALIFIVTSGNIEFSYILYYNRVNRKSASLWYDWCDFLVAGYQAYIAYVIIALTVLTVVLLLTRRKPYDEYHVDRLVTCLVVAMLVTIIAIALFFLVILSDSNGVVEKFMLFITIHWAAVVLADFGFVLSCRRK